MAKRSETKTEDITLTVQDIRVSVADALKVLKENKRYKVINTVDVIAMMTRLWIKLSAVPDTPPTEIKNNYYQELFDHLHDQHGLICVQSEMDDIIRLITYAKKL